MRKHGLIFCSSLILAIMITSGCGRSLSNRETGALTGGAIGSGLGAIVGNQVGSTGAGIAIGGALGALSGVAVGSGLDDVDQKQTEQDEKLRRQQEEIDRQRRELDELRNRQGSDYQKYDDRDSSY